MLKIGVFGVGHLGKFHLNNWKNIDGTELIGFYDPNDEAALGVLKNMASKGLMMRRNCWRKLTPRI
jgi:predicted dehydrogenase